MPPQQVSIFRKMPRNLCDSSIQQQNWHHRCLFFDLTINSVLSFHFQRLRRSRDDHAFDDDEAARAVRVGVGGRRRLGALP